MNIKFKCASLFSSAGIGEYFLDKLKIDVVVANELIEKRAQCYNYFYPKVKMISGDITQNKIRKAFISYARKCKVLLATPPCQGVSSLGKNKKQNAFIMDHRNYLIYDIFQIIDECDFNFILIENVPRYLKMLFPYNEELLTLEQILLDRYSTKYKIEIETLNAQYFGIAQSRPRAIIKMFDKSKKWPWPEKETIISLKEAIGHLPSLEPGESSEIPNHYAKKHNERSILALRHTPTGKSALRNKKFFPKKANGERINGFHNTYKRMKWDAPAHARTTYSASISSHNNVHPGKKLDDNTYSDPRVLTLLETFIVSSLPENFNFPDDCSDNFKYTMIGEAIPPLLLKKIFETIKV